MDNSTGEFEGNGILDRDRLPLTIYRLREENRHLGLAIHFIVVLISAGFLQSALYTRLLHGIRRALNTATKVQRGHASAAFAAFNNIAAI